MNALLVVCVMLTDANFKGIRVNLIEAEVDWSKFGNWFPVLTIFRL